MRRKITRSRNGVVGGVCSGIARAFECDSLVVRILFVASMPVTGGVAGIAYLVLWKLLPLASALDDPYEVRPETVLSETYGRVEYVSSRPYRRPKDPDSRYVVSSRTSNRFVSVGHLPPQPPSCWHGSTAERPTADHLAVEQRVAEQRAAEQQARDRT